MHFTSRSNSFSSESEANRGFALIITISLMAFLVLLLVTVGTFTRIETQVAGYTQKQAIAREHAKKAMEHAIAQLQKYAGPDQRVTARAEITTRPIQINSPIEQNRYWNNANPYWTGVWDTTQTGQVPVWLVSGNEHFDMRGQTGYPQESFVGTQQDGESGGLRAPDPDDPDNRSIWLVGPGSALPASRQPPDPDLIDGRVKAQKQPIRVDYYPGLGMSQVNPPTLQVQPSGGHVIGNYAWVVLDEGVKASLGHAGLRRPHFEHQARIEQQPLPNPLPDDWDSALLQDEILNFLNPARFGFEANVRDWANVPGVDASGFSFGTYNPSYASSWLRILSRHQASIFEDNGGLTGDDLRWTFHNTTSSAQAVFANTSPGGGDRMKRDLSVSDPDVNYAGVFANSVPERGNPNMDGSNRIHPIATLEPLNENPSGAPVVKQVRLHGRFVKLTDFISSAVEFELRPMIEVWNPFTADLAWIDDNTFAGYRFQLRIAYDPEVGGGTDPMFIRFGAGIHWQGEDPEDSDETKDVYTWWFGEDIDFFGLQRVIPSDPADELHTFEFVTDGAGFTHSSSGRNGGTRLLAGESAVFSGISGWLAGEIVGERQKIAMAGFGGMSAAFAEPGQVPPFQQEMPRGGHHTGGRRVMPGEGFKPPFPDPTVLLNPRMIAARPTIVLAPNAPRPRFRVQVYAVPDNVTSLQILNEQRIPLLPDNTHLEPAFLSDVIANHFNGQDQGMHGEGPAGETVWNNVWSNPDVTRYGNIDNFHQGGTAMPFTIGIWKGGSQGNVLTYNPDSSFTDPRQMSFNFEWGNSPSQLHENLPQSIATWGNLNGYGYGYSNGGVGDPSTEFVNLLDAPRMPYPSTGASDDAFSSMVALTGNSNYPLRFDNPRVRPYSRSGGIDQEVIDNLTGNIRFQQAAFSVMADGAFNVNSTSVQAWAALLSSFGRYQLGDGNWHGPKLQIWSPRTARNIQLGDPIAGAGPESPTIHSPFPRFSHAPGATFFGRVDLDLAQVGERSLWRNGFRELRPLDLGFPNAAHHEFGFVSAYPNDDSEYVLAAIPMAEYIVERIKEYYSNNGRPFRSLADFRNSNIMRDAIDNVEWIDMDTGASQTGLNWYRDPVFGPPHGTGGNWERIPRSSPSYLTQNDMFRALGSVLTARSDTFLIRAYGDAQNPVTGRVEARAYLEAVVQRVPVPINPNNPDDILPSEYQNPPDVPNSNVNYGRRFELVSFRWLDPSEI